MTSHFMCNIFFSRPTRFQVFWNALGLWKSCNWHNFVWLAKAGLPCIQENNIYDIFIYPMAFSPIHDNLSFQNLLKSLVSS